MAINVSDKGGGDFKRLPEGTHLAVCDMVIDLGIQPTSFGDKHKIFLRWQVPGERLEYTDDKGVKHDGPMVIGNFYTASLNKKAVLRKDLEGWRGRAFTDEELEAFDMVAVLGKPCMITVVWTTANGKTYDNVTGVTGVPKGVPIPALEGKAIKYGPDDAAQWNDLPEWLQKKVDAQIKTDEANTDGPAPTGPDDLNDDIGF